MRFNNGYERKKFEEAWKNLREKYEAAGMEKEAIEEMYRFDLEVYRSERIYCLHTQFLPAERIESEDGTGYVSPFLAKYGERMLVEAPVTDADRRYGWIDELDDEKMVKAVKNLGQDEIELLTLFIYEGFTQKEIAKKIGRNQSSVSERIGRILKFLKTI